MIRVLDVRQSDGTYVTALARTLSGHRRILDALRAGRADLARTYSAAHMAGVESWLLREGEPPARRDRADQARHLRSRRG